jgi:hypothetical protein
MKIRDVLLTPIQLAERWNCSVKKLNADRLRGTGCPYVKIGRLVRYHDADVQFHEVSNVRQSTSHGHHGAT